MSKNICGNMKEVNMNEKTATFELEWDIDLGEIIP